MAINYTGVDLDRYNAGNKFYSQDRFLQGIGLDKPAITFNPSKSNTGIMSAYNPYPIIPLYESGDGDGPPPGPRGPGYGYTSLYDQSNKVQGPQTKEDFENYLNDIGVETITKEEEEFAKAQELKKGLVTIGKAALFGPIEYTLGSGLTKGIGFGINKAKDFFGGSDGEFDKDQYDEGKKSAAAQAAANRDYARSGGESGAAKSTNDTRGGAPSHSTRNLMSYGGRAGYAGGGMPMKEIKGQDHMLAYITPNEANKLVRLGGQETMTSEGIPAYPERDNYGYSNQDDFDKGNYAASNDPTVSGYARGDTKTGDGNPPPSYSNNESPSNLTFNLVKDIDPAFSYSNRFGTLGGILDTTRTIEEEEPVGSLGYYDPSGNFGIGLETDKGIVGAANLGNFNLGYTGVGGPTVNYMGGFAGDAGRFGANYNRDTGLNFGFTFNKKFNNGGIVGLYR